MTNLTGQSDVSYCRWSSDSFRCDLYCYEDVSGGWTTHVAGRRRIMPDDLRDPLDSLLDLKDKASIEKAVKGHAEFTERMRELPFQDIELPEAGETFNDPTLEEFRTRVSHLLEAGFNGCPGLLESIDEEIAEQ